MFLGKLCGCKLAGRALHEVWHWQFIGQLAPGILRLAAYWIMERRFARALGVLWKADAPGGAEVIVCGSERDGTEHELRKASRRRFTRREMVQIACVAQCSACGVSASLG